MSRCVNRGTIGGSLAHADPAADYPPAMLALEAELRLESESGARQVKAEDFFVDLMTAAHPGEILTQITISSIPEKAGYSYLKHRHPASGFATIGVAVLVGLDAAGNCQCVRAGITGLGA